MNTTQHSFLPAHQNAPPLPPHQPITIFRRHGCLALNRVVVAEHRLHSVFIQHTSSSRKVVHLGISVINGISGIKGVELLWA